MVKRTIYQENKTIANAYTHNNITLKYVKQKLMDFQREIDKSSNMVRGSIFLSRSKSGRHKNE